MKCLICGKSNEKSVCSDCQNLKKCKVCNILKTDFYKYRNGKLYSTCIEGFNKKVKCEFCNKEFNKTCLSKHLKRCIINQDNTNNEIINHNENHDNNDYTNNDNENQIDDDNNQIDNNQIDDDNENRNNQIDDNNNQIDNNCNRTLIVGPSFCGKTHLLLNKLQLIRLDNPEQKMCIITRSPEQ